MKHIVGGSVSYTCTLSEHQILSNKKELMSTTSNVKKDKNSIAATVTEKGLRETS